MGLRESGLEIIASLIGSSLLLYVVTQSYTEFNQPHILINVIPHQSQVYFTEDDEIPVPKVQYYEIVVRNDGRSSATNMTLSMFFFSNIINSAPILHDENVKVDIIQKHVVKTKNVIEPSLAVANLPRLAKGGMIIIHIWTDANRDDPYYISAAYDQGSTSYSSNLINPRQSGDQQFVIYPEILVGRNNIPPDILILIVASVLSVIFFAITLGIRRAKQQPISKKERSKIDWVLDLFLPLPLIIVGSIFIFYVFEVFPRSVLVPSLFLPPIDVTFPVSLLESVKTIDGKSFTQYELLVSAIVLCTISFIIRSIIAFHIAKLIIKRLKHPISVQRLNNNNSILSQQTYGMTNLFPFSLLIMGLPIHSIILLFFSESIYVEPVNLTIILLIVDVIRMSILTLIIPMFNPRPNTIVKWKFYGAVVTAIVTGIFHLEIGLLILRSLFNVYRIMIESLISSINQVNLTLLAMLTFFIIVGTIQIIWGWSILKHRTKTWLDLGIIGFVILTLFWIIIRLMLPFILNSNIHFQLSEFLQLNYDQINQIAYSINSIGIMIILLQIIYLIITIDLRAREKRIFHDQIFLLKTYSYLQRLARQNNWKYLLNIAFFNIKKKRKWNYPIIKVPLSFSIVGFILIFIPYFYILSSPNSSVYDIGNIVNLDILPVEKNIEKMVVVNSDNQTGYSKLYSMNSYSDELSIIEGSDEQFQKREIIKLSAQDKYQTKYLAINSNTSIAYLIASDSGNIYAIDSYADDIKPMSEIKLDDEEFTTSISVNSNTNRVYLTTNYGKVYVIDGCTNEMIGDIPIIGTITCTNRIIGSITTEHRGFAISAVNPKTNMVYVMVGILGVSSPSTIYMINDIDNPKIVDKITIRENIVDLDVNPKTNMVYATGEDSGKVYVINGETNTVSDFTINGETNSIEDILSRKIAIDPDKNRIYVGNEAFPPMIHVIDGNTNSIIVNITLSHFPGDMIIDSDMHRLYVTKFSPELSIINTQTNTIMPPQYGYLRSTLFGQGK